MRARILTATVAAAAVTAAISVSTPAHATTYPSPGSTPPAHDPFYVAPQDIGSYAPGQVVASRSYSPTLFGGSSVVHAYQIAYRTNDSHGTAELGVTTLLVPTSPWYGGGSRPAVSLQSPEDSTGSQCAPSYTMATGNDGQDLGLVGPLLSAGWAVSVPDYEGPGSHYAAGPQAGHAVLDGIRAVRSFNHDGIGAGSAWALDGYSGGAQATGWAAQLQPSYAPDVRLVGAAMGGTPADLSAVARSLDGGFAAGFEFAAAWGIAQEWPESGITGLLNAQGVQDFAAVAGKCESDLLTSFAGKSLSSDTNVADPLSVPSVKAVLDADKLGANAPATPIYDYHALTDEIVPVAQDDTLVASWCAQGATVTKVREPLGEHVQEAVTETPVVIGWLTSRFNGVAPFNTCGTY